MDKFKEECGIFGIYGHTEAANPAYLGLYALPHRGQGRAGIAGSDGGRRGAPKFRGYCAPGGGEARAATPAAPTACTAAPADTPTGASTGAGAGR